MDLKEIGEHLRREREKQGLSLEDVIQKTKISRRNLKAIERGDQEDLPHPVYAKGFVKNYAQLLGLDVEQMGHLFARNYTLAEEEFPEQEAEEPEPVVEELPAFEPEAERSSWPVVSIVLSVVLVLVLGWLVYDVYFGASNGEKRVQQKQQALAPQVNNTNATSLNNNTKALNEDIAETTDEAAEIKDDSEVAQKAETQAKQKIEGNQTDLAAEVKQDAEDSTEPVLQVEDQNVVAEESVTAANESAQNVASRESEQQVAAESAAEQPAGEEKHEVQISAYEACWFSAQFDGKDRDVYLRPGEGITLHFSESLKLRLGNAGGVDIRYDGKAYSMDVESGEVKTLEFP